MVRLASLTGVGFLLAVAGYAFMLDGGGQPVAEKRPVNDVYHGITVVDNYRWLENYDSPAVRRWSDAQSAYTRRFLDSIPCAEAVRGRVGKLLESPGPDWSRLAVEGGVLFAMKSQPPREQPLLITLQSPEDPSSEKVVLDPNAMDTSGATTVDFYAPSPDGRLVAVSLSHGGSEAGDLYLVDVRTGQPLPGVIPGVNRATASGSVAWNKDGTGFYYTRYPRKGERPANDLDFYQQIYFHRLGTPPSSDAYAAGKDFPRIAETRLERSVDGGEILAHVANGDGGDFEHFVKLGAGSWKQVSTFRDRIIDVQVGPDGALYLLSRKDAPNGRILRLARGARLQAATVVVSESSVSIEGFKVTRDVLLVHDMNGGPSRMRVFTLNGEPRGVVPLPPMSSVAEGPVDHSSGILLRVATYLAPPAWYRYTVQGNLEKTGLAATSPADFSSMEVVREFATSKDGTRIPLNVIRPRGTRLDHSNPVLLTGYGGFGLSQAPGFDPLRIVWLEQGGVYAIANLRGGGEYGEAWHLGGNLTHKQNVFDDFAACAEHMIDTGYTDRQKLAIQGGSNGGLLMMAVTVQHPDLFRAVVSSVGLYDMLRFEQYPNGVFNTTEYGSVRDPDQFRALYAYSPYHHVADGTRYPAVLFFSGTNDSRVNPADSRKMTARLQAATASNLPVLLRVTSTGHGIGSPRSERIDRVADEYAFLFDQLGVKCQRR